MNVQEMRDYVRSQLELDDEELPDARLNIYLQDAFERTLAMDNRWPRNERTWDLSLVVGTNEITIPAEINIPSIMSVVSARDQYPLAIISQENAESWFVRNDSVAYSPPLYVSIWGNKMRLWPQLPLDYSYDLVVRAYAQPAWASGASVVPDLDPRLHIAMCYYAMALCYAQQEDEVLEGVYMARWTRDVQTTIKSILEPVHNRPLVMHGGSRVGGMPSFVINPPVTP